MNKNYPQEYLDSARDQGYRDFWDEEHTPPDTYPLAEKRAWMRGYKSAERELEGRSNN